MACLLLIKSKLGKAMRIESMSWKQVQEDIHTNAAMYQGRRVLYIKPGELEWFDSEEEATEKGFHLAQVSEIHKLAAKQLQGLELKNLENEFSSLLDVSKGWNLLANPDSTPEELHLHGLFMLANGKQIENQAHKEIGRRCLGQAATKFILAGDSSKANICKQLLIQSVEFTKEHPLFDLDSVTDVERTAFSLEKGAFVPNLNGGHLKNGTVKVSSRAIDNQVINQLSFKISSPARVELHTHLQFIQDNTEEFQSTVCKGLCKEVIVSSEKDRYLTYREGSFHSDEVLETDGDVVQIDFVGLGKMKIGSSVDVGCSINRVELELPFGQGLESAQKMLYATGLTVDLHECQTADIERRKVMAMVHNYFPRLSFDLENTSEVYTLDPAILRKEICSLEPKMEEIFEFYEQNPGFVSEQEVYPGKTTIALLDIPSKVRESGGVGLMIGLPYGDVPRRAALLLKTGPLSTQDRYEAGLLVSGASSSTDYATGGGDSVFTRMITETSIEDEVSVNMYPLSGKAQLLIDLDVLSRGGYAFSEDAFGAKNRFGDCEPYKERLNLWETAALVSDPDRNLYQNEFMVKNHIHPSFIRGIVAVNERMREEIIAEVRKEGQETINGKSIEEFVQVGQFFKKEMWE